MVDRLRLAGLHRWHPKGARAFERSPVRWAAVGTVSVTQGGGRRAWCTIVVDEEEGLVFAVVEVRECGWDRQIEPPSWKKRSRLRGVTAPGDGVEGVLVEVLVGVEGLVPKQEVDGCRDRRIRARDGVDRDDCARGASILCRCVGRNGAEGVNAVWRGQGQPGFRWRR